MGSALNSGQFVRNRSTGVVGVTALDPYGVCGHGEVAISFAGFDDPDRNLGSGYPVLEWEVVPYSTLGAADRKKFSWARTAQSQHA